MSARLLLLAVLGGFMWAAHSFVPGTPMGATSAGVTMALGFVLLAAFFAGQFVNELGLPKLTGYLAVGVLAGPSVTGLVTENMVERMQLVNGVAIALIALTAGGEMNFQRMRPLLRTIGWITLTAVVGTAILLAGTLFLLAPILPFFDGLDPLGAGAVALTLGITVAAQSPAVVIAVRAELDAEGPVTRTVLGVVVVADLVIIVLFAIASALCRAALEGDADAIRATGSVFFEIFGSMGAGLFVGAVLLLYLTKVRGGAGLFLIVVCIVVAEVGTRLHLDPLITALTAGVLVENASDKGHVLLEETAAASLPLYLVFFAVAGASIHLNAMVAVALPAVVIVVVRAIGLLGGAALGVRIAGGPPQVGRYAGFGLLPQAGLAIALALLFARSFPSLGPDAATLAMGVVAINELVAPVFFRRALVRSGEARAHEAPNAAVSAASAARE